MNDLGPTVLIIGLIFILVLFALLLKEGVRSELGWLLAEQKKDNKRMVNYFRKGGEYWNNIPFEFWILFPALILLGVAFIVTRTGLVSPHSGSMIANCGGFMISSLVILTLIFRGKG